MRHVHCPLCGLKLVPRLTGDEGLVPHCQACNRSFFDSFSTCVIVLVANEHDEVALLRNAGSTAPWLGLVAGYVTPGESAEEAARREVCEELGLELESLAYQGSLWFGKRDQLMLGYIARAPKAPFSLSSEIDEAQWVALSEVRSKIRPPSPDSAANMLLDIFLGQARENRARP